MGKFADRLPSTGESGGGLLAVGGVLLKVILLRIDQRRKIWLVSISCGYDKRLCCLLLFRRERCSPCLSFIFESFGFCECGICGL